MIEVPQSSIVRSSDGTAVGFRTLGRGAPIIVLGGGMRTAQDYLPFAAVLAGHFTVHVIDRRGRGLSGPLGDHYSVERECDDLLAVQAATGATMLFGHSYGGLVALETATRSGSFDRIALYEPGISVGGSISTAWLPRYRQLLENGHGRAAFAYFVQQSGHAPGPVARLPLWYVRAVMWLAVRKDQWKRFEPLLRANLAEHQQIAACDGNLCTYAAIGSELLLLDGSRSPAFTASQPLTLLGATLRRCTVEILDGLNHHAPDERAPAVVARRVLAFMKSEHGGGEASSAQAPDGSARCP